MAEEKQIVICGACDEKWNTYTQDRRCPHNQLAKCKGVVIGEMKKRPDLVFPSEYYEQRSTPDKEKALANIIKRIRVSPGLRMSEWIKEIIALLPDIEEANPERRREFEAFVKTAIEEAKKPLIEAIKQIAIPSLKYCEDKYGHDNMARLNLEAALKQR